eukprot:1160716-Pelagomonas_calceolata.AAC.3
MWHQAQHGGEASVVVGPTWWLLAQLGCASFIVAGVASSMMWQLAQRGGQSSVVAASPARWCQLNCRWGGVIQDAAGIFLGWPESKWAASPSCQLNCQQILEVEEGKQRSGKGKKGRDVSIVYRGYKNMNLGVKTIPGWSSKPFRGDLRPGE